MSSAISGAIGSSRFSPRDTRWAGCNSNTTVDDNHAIFAAVCAAGVRVDVPPIYDKFRLVCHSQVRHIVACGGLDTVAVHKFNAGVVGLTIHRSVGQVLVETPLNRHFTNQHFVWLRHKQWPDRNFRFNAMLNGCGNVSKVAKRNLTRRITV